MADHDASRPQPSSDERTEPTSEPGFETVESYEVDDGVVLYDAENPLAWVRADSPVAPDEQR